MIRLGLACLIIAVLTIAPAIYTSASLGRWGNAKSLELAGERLAHLPTQFSEWQMISEEELSVEAQELLQFTKSTRRTYQSMKDSAVVTLILIVGRPGPIVRHPPEFCYAVRDKKLVQLEPLTLTVNEKAHTFRLSRIEPSSHAGESFVIATAWSSGEEFNTTDYPRAVYGGKEFIYAIQLATENSRHPESKLREFAAKFLKEFDASNE